MSHKIERQNEAIIALIARNTLGVEAIRRIVRLGKRNPEAYVKVYNSLDGTRGVSEFAKMAGVSQPTMTVVFQAWEAQGIIYDVGSKGKSRYHRLLSLPPEKRKTKGENR